jgi:hypothetical protein
MDMLGFDYFKLLDLLTIARSRKHIEKYYGTRRPARFPEASQARSTSRPTSTRRRVPLHPRDQRRDPPPEPRAYAPLRYVLPHKQAAYDEKYSTEVAGGEGLLPAGRPRGEPDPPAARECAQAHGKLGVTRSP